MDTLGPTYISFRASYHIKANFDSYSLIWHIYKNFMVYKQIENIHSINNEINFVGISVLLSTVIALFQGIWLTNMSVRQVD